MSFYKEEDFELVSGDDAAEARLFFVNFTSSLLPVNATLLAIAAAVLAGLAALAYLLFTLRPDNDSGDSYGYGQSYGGSTGYEDYRGHRNRRDTEDTEWIRLLTLLDVGTDLYTSMNMR